MSQMSPISPNSSSQTTRWVLVAVFVVILLVAIWLSRSIILLALAAIILVVLITMPIRFLVRRGMKRSLATIISLVGIIALIGLLVMVALPTLVEQFTTLATDTVPRGIAALVEAWDNPQPGSPLEAIRPLLENIEINNELINNLAQQLGSALSNISVSVVPVVSGVASTILNILIVIFLSMYFLSDPQMHEEGVVKLFPIWYRSRIREILDRIDLTLRGWLKATLLSMIFVGVGTGVGLAILGIREAVALGVLAGVLAFVPNFGPIIALIPSLAVGIEQTPQNLGWIFVIIYGISFIQSQVVGPLLVSESIQLPAVLVLLGQIIAGGFFGFLGIMLAVPITAILMVLVQEIYIKDMLGDYPAKKGQPVEKEEVYADEA